MSAYEPKRTDTLRDVATPLQADLQPVGDTNELPSPVHDCWSTIGVNGNGTCRELQKFVHCRNCPVYSAAGIQLLDRPLTADYRSERTAHYAQSKKLKQPTLISLVLFRLGPEWLALPTPVFQEVAERRPVHTLPHRRRSILLGLVNIRGELLICTSLARLLGLEAVADNQGTRAVYDRLLVAGWDGHRMVFPVDEINGVQRVRNDEMKEPPSTISKSTHACTQAVFEWQVGGEAVTVTVGFLNVNAVFSALNRNLT